MITDCSRISLAHCGGDGAGWSGPPTPWLPPFARGGKCKGFAGALRWRRSRLIRPSPLRPPLCKGGSKGFRFCAFSGGDGAGWSGPHSPCGPPCKGGKVLGFARISGGDGAGWSGPTPAPLCKGGKRGFRLRIAVATELTGPASTPWPPLCKGGKKVRSRFCALAVATELRLVRPPPSGPPLQGGSAHCVVATELVDPDPTPPRPPLCNSDFLE